METAMLTQNVIQTITVSGNPGLIVLGAILLAVGIILGHFFPSRYWIALIALGIVLLVVGAILLLFGAF